MSNDDSSHHEWLEMVEQSYRDHIAALTDYAAAMTGSRFIAQDICHEVFRKMIVGPKNPDTLSLKYLIAAVRNESRNAIRYHRRAQHYQELYLERLFDEAEVGDGDDLSEESRHLISLLPLQQRAVIYLWCHGLTYPEIGGELGISKKTVQSHLGRAKNTLREIAKRERERESKFWNWKPGRKRARHREHRKPLRYK